MSSRQYPKLKEVDDVLGGAEAWENVDSTEGSTLLLMLNYKVVLAFIGCNSFFLSAECPDCGHKKAFFMQIQTRSADEPMTTFYKCCDMKCGHRWRD